MPSLKRASAGQNTTRPISVLINDKATNSEVAPCYQLALLVAKKRSEWPFANDVTFTRHAQVLFTAPPFLNVGSLLRRTV